MPPGRHVVRALDAAGARFRALAALSFSGPLHQPRAGIPASTDEMFVVLHLLSHGASWRTFDFLGFAIKRVRGRHGRMVIHTYPSKRSLQTVKAKVRQITHHTGPDQAPDQLLHRVNRVLRGWCNYFRHGVSSATFGYLRHYAYWRVVGWLRRKHPKRNWRWLRRTYLTERWPSHNDVELFNPAAVHITRYRYRGTRIPTPWEQGVIAYRDHTTAMDYLEGLIAR